MRVTVACINWTHAEAPHALSYLLKDGEAMAEKFHPTWAEAMERGNDLARRLANSSAPTAEATSDSSSTGGQL